MLDDKALARFDAAGLRAYIQTLHRALAHVSTASVEAQRFIDEQTSPPATEGNGVDKTSVAVAALAKALGNQ